jgi:hypothetical protein
VKGYVEHYNNVRLNSAVGYITPKDVLSGRQREIHADRDRKLEGAKTAAGSPAAGCVIRFGATLREATFRQVNQ